MTDYKPLGRATEKLFETTLQNIAGKLQIVRKDNSVGLKLLSKFNELNQYNSLFVHKVTELRGKNDSFLILLVEKHLTIIEHRRHARVEKEIEEIEPVLLFSVPHDMGRVLIRPETIADKLVDVVTKTDIDFKDYPVFSRNYYVAGERADAVLEYLPARLMDSLNQIKGLTIEINGHWGLMRLEKNLTEDVLMLLLGVGYQLTK